MLFSSMALDYKVNVKNQNYTDQKYENSLCQVHIFPPLATHIYFAINMPKTIIPYFTLFQYLMHISAVNIDIFIESRKHNLWNIFRNQPNAWKHKIKTNHKVGMLNKLGRNLWQKIRGKLAAGGRHLVTTNFAPLLFLAHKKASHMPTTTNLYVFGNKHVVFH